MIKQPHTPNKIRTEAKSLECYPKVWSVEGLGSIKGHYHSGICVIMNRLDICIQSSNTEKGGLIWHKASLVVMDQGQNH